jgi:hypothetical protein
MLPNPDEPQPSGPRRAGAPGRRPPIAAAPGLLLLRIAIVALGLSIGIVLLARGDLVLGVLLVAFAGLRLGVFVTMRRRRSQWRAARGGFGAP